MEVFGGADDPYGGGWDGISSVGGQTIGGGFEGSGEVDAGLADIMAAAANTPNTSTLTRQQTNAVPVDNSFWATAKNAFRTFMTPTFVNLLAPMVGNPPQYGINRTDLEGKLNYMNVDTDTYNWDLLAPPVPHNPHDRVMAEMTGTDVSRAPAIGQTSGGINYGPGWPMDENFYAGYGTNPFTGASAADPSDPYIRKRRGTEIAGMVGPQEVIMGWSDADALGVGESSQGMDANPAGGGLGADMSGNIFGRRGYVDEVSAILARMGLPAAGYGLNNTQQAAYQAGFNPYDPNQQSNPFSEYTDIQSGQLPNHRSRIGTMDANALPMAMGGYPQPAGQSGPYPMGGMPMGSQATGWNPGVGGSYNPSNSNGGLMSDGGGERPWWLENMGGGMRPDPININLGGNEEPLVNWPMPYTRPRRNTWESDL